MRKTFVLAVFMVAVVWCAESFAEVRALTDQNANNRAGGFGNFSVNAGRSSQKECNKVGYRKTSCPGGQRLKQPCPYSELYFRECCPQEYDYTIEFCEARGMTASEDTCASLHACY